MWRAPGGVLSPCLFAVCLNDVVTNVQNSNFGCHFGIFNMSIILYADDILLLAPSVFALCKLLHIVEQYLASIDMCLNTKKSVCMRIGPHYRDYCEAVTSLSGDKLHFVDSIKYLGVTLQSGKKFKVATTDNKKSFYKTANTVFSRVGRCASELVISKLIDSKCVPALLYGLDAAPINLTLKRTLDFICRRTMMKIFHTGSIDVVDCCCEMLKIDMYSERLIHRKLKFLSKYVSCSNLICQVYNTSAQAEICSIQSHM